MNSSNCELCAFENPKVSATAIIIKNNAVLLLKRNEEPFKGMWDFPGGYANKGETSAYAIQREIQEELGVIPWHIRYITTFTGTGFYRETAIPINNFFYLVDIAGYDIKLNEENSEFVWMPIKDLDPKDIAFDSNSRFSLYLKQNFYYDLDKVRDLIFQLDTTARFDEQKLYIASLEGYVSKQWIDDKLIGMGWIFPRQTMLRKQAVVEDMIVDKEYRGFGYGKHLLDDL